MEIFKSKKTLATQKKILAYLMVKLLVRITSYTLTDRLVLTAWLGIKFSNANQQPLNSTLIMVGLKQIT